MKRGRPKGRKTKYKVFIGAMKSGNYMRGKVFDKKRIQEELNGKE